MPPAFPPERVPPTAPFSSVAPAPVELQPTVQTPTPRQQSWGVIISIVIIVLMIVIGAFYAWGQRIAQERALIEAASSTANTY